MNLGIQDGVDLGHSLAQALIGRSPDRLDTYDARRRPIAQEVVTFTDRLTRLATAGPRLRVVRNAALATMSHLPPVQRRLAWQLSGLTHRQ
jgi:2-polyprenyl-6-methoxyphenol hydroxylase-like FAD-dependent oxidoreductase